MIDLAQARLPSRLGLFICGDSGYSSAIRSRADLSAKPLGSYLIHHQSSSARYPAVRMMWTAGRRQYGR